MVTLCYTRNGRQEWERLPNLGEAVIYMEENKIKAKNEPFVFSNRAENEIVLYEDLIDAYKRGVIKPVKMRIQPGGWN